MVPLAAANAKMIGVIQVAPANEVKEVPLVPGPGPGEERQAGRIKEMLLLSQEASKYVSFEPTSILTNSNMNTRSRWPRTVLCSCSTSDMTFTIHDTLPHSFGLLRPLQRTKKFLPCSHRKPSALVKQRIVSQLS